MADHGGNVIETQIAGEYHASDIRTFESFGLLSLLLGVSVDASLTQWTSDSQGIVELSAWDYVADNKVYLTPTAIDAGLIGNDQDYGIEIWNADNEGVTLTSIIQSSSDGFVLDIPIPPVFFTAETVYVFTLTILKDGPPVQSTTITFTFDSGDVKTITITGKRMEVFPYEMDASSSLSITLKYQTVIATSNKYVEQRRSLIKEPDIQIDASFWFELTKTQSFVFSMRAFADKILAVPIWAEEFRLVSDPDGLSIIEVADPDGDLAYCYFFETSRFLLLMNSDDNFYYELLEIVSINSGTGEITVTANVSKSFAVETTRICPVLTAFAPEIASCEHLTNEIVRYNLTFEGYR